MDKKGVLLSFAIIALLFIAGCQQYLSKDAVGSGGSNCPSIEYCNVNGLYDNRCQTCYDLITMEGYPDEWAYVDKGTHLREAAQTVEARRSAFTDEEAAARFAARSDARAGINDIPNNILAGGDQRVLVDAMQAAGVDVEEPPKLTEEDWSAWIDYKRGEVILWDEEEWKEGPIQIRFKTEIIKGVPVTHAQFRVVATGKVIDESYFFAVKKDSVVSFAGLTEVLSDLVPHLDSSLYGLFELKRLYFEGLIGKAGGNIEAVTHDSEVIARVNSLRNQYASHVNALENKYVGVENNQKDLAKFADEFQAVDQKFHGQLNQILYGVSNSADVYQTLYKYDNNAVFNQWAKTITPVQILQQISYQDIPDNWISRPDNSGSYMDDILYGPSH